MFKVRVKSRLNVNSKYSLKVNKILFILSFLPLLCPLAVSAKDRALLIGINDYASVKPLNGTHNDINSMQRLLQQDWGVASSDIKILLDKQATKKGILKAFDQWLVEPSAPGDRIFFYYSGHGYYIKDQPNGDEKDGFDEAIVAYDAGAKANGDWINMVRDDEIGERLDKLQGRSVLVMMDSCHSGTATRGSLLPEKFTKTPTLMKPTRSATRNIMGDTDIVIHQKESNFVDSSHQTLSLFAVSPNQLAREYKGKNGVEGLFTRSVVDGVSKKLADANQDGKVTLSELHEYTTRRSNAFCEKIGKNSCGAGLTPQIETTKISLDANILDFGKTTQASPNSPQEDVANILVHGNDAGLELGVYPKSNLKIGKYMTFQVQTNRPGSLLLFDIDVNDNVTQIYPNEYVKNKSSRVRANVDIKIPDAYYGFRFPIEGPVGKGRIVAILVEDELQSGASFDANRGFAAVEKSKQWMNQLRLQLNQLVHLDDGSNRETRWSINSSEYEIVQ